MSKTIEIRTELKAGDFGTFLRLGGQQAQQQFGYPMAFEGYIAQTIAEYLLAPRPRNRIWIAEIDSQMVGTIAVVDRVDKAQLRWFLVDPALQGQGIGSRLLTTALEYCHCQAFETVWLSTFAESLAAIHLYEKFGFSLAQRNSLALMGRNYEEFIFEKPMKKPPEGGF